VTYKKFQYLKLSHNEMRCPLGGGGDNEKNRKNYLPSVSGFLLRGVQRGTCVARWVCRQLRMWLDTTEPIRKHVNYLLQL